MSPEEQFARRFCDLLDQEGMSLEPLIAERLRAARVRALDRQHVALAGEAPIVGAGGTAILGRGHGGHPWRNLLVILSLLLGMGIAYYWNGFEQADENEEIDSALLADDLPPKAYLDPGFQAWLSHYAHSAR
ncbi:MAG: DUF3619 family protein [Rhodocyclaceae bacterium]|jgi:hypothetical protein|nr:DUF3619 family protein [Rhodocyclaceae bacterium]